MTHDMITRRQALITSAATVALIGRAGTTSAKAETYPPVQAYRNPGCGCCEKWAGLLRDAGFAVTMEDDAELDSRKAKAGVPAGLAGCHTAFTGGYVIEGHVPVDDIKRLLADKLAVLGLAVPGMPAESPGMEAGGPVEKFDVLAFTSDGSHTVFSSH
ncbi:MAG: DUF411 domain-containing protein [Aestuariivirga sp.]